MKLVLKRCPIFVPVATPYSTVVTYIHHLFLQQKPLHCARSVLRVPNDSQNNQTVRPYASLPDSLFKAKETVSCGVGTELLRIIETKSVPTKHLSLDRGKPRTTLLEFAGRLLPPLQPLGVQIYKPLW